MNIQQLKYQYVEPKPKYVTKTQGNTYELKPEWYTYFNAIFDKNYFTEDELEFLKALRDDLQRELDEIDRDIDENIKVREKRLK